LFIILISLLLLERGGGKVAVGCAAVEMSSFKVLGKEREQNGLQRAAPCVCHAKFQHDISISCRIDESCVNTYVERKLTGVGVRHGLEGSDGKVTGCARSEVGVRLTTEAAAAAAAGLIILVRSRVSTCSAQHRLYNVSGQPHISEAAPVPERVLCTVLSLLEPRSPLHKKMHVAYCL
jgi:hypothetical protein